MKVHSLNGAESPFRRVLLLGPPAGGKSTIARRLLASLGEGISYSGLDAEVVHAAGDVGVEPPFPRSLIDAAVRRLLARQSKNALTILELPHHDYVALISTGILCLCRTDLVALISAPLPELEKRNAERQNPVPTEYVRCCAEALQALVSNSMLLAPAVYLAADSGACSDDAIAQAIERRIFASDEPAGGTGNLS